MGRNFHHQIRRRRIQITQHDDTWVVHCRKRWFSFPCKSFTREQVLNMFRRLDA